MSLTQRKQTFYNRYFKFFTSVDKL